jgi:GntR family transcriptional repressor for pyruvate dehydrogenase complex
MASPVSSATKRRAGTLTQKLVSSMSEQIRSGAIRAGDKLPTEFEIVREQGVSRTVVREAISQLQAARLVETRHGIGTFVLEPPRETDLRIDPSEIVTVRDVLAMLELRISLETEAAGLAAARRSDEQLKDMLAALDAFRLNLEDGGDTVGPDYRFHLQIAQATENRYFTEIMRNLGLATIPRSRVSAVPSSAEYVLYLRGVNREHEQIYQAVAGRDPEAARAAMRSHLTNSRERLRRAHDAAAVSITHP